MTGISKALIILFILLSGSVFSQKQISEQSYNLDFLAAKFIDAGESKKTVLVFKYQPKEKKEYKLFVSTRIKYRIVESDSVKTEIIGDGKHGLKIYGEDINKRNPAIYNMIKDKVKLSKKKKFAIIVFLLTDITNEYVDHMQFTYGLWEPENTQVRIEKTYDIQIDR